MKTHARGVRTAFVVCVLIVASCFTGAVSYAAKSTTSHAVGVFTETLVDTSRPTPASGTNPARPERTLVTTIWYPAKGNAKSATPRDGATPDRSGRPYPLIVFGHGLGGSPKFYEALLSRWAAEGYVVAAPLFPLTSSETPGGTDAADTASQPGDVSYVITQVLKASARRTGPLSGLVDPHAIGVSGHSNGAITTLALAANSCCPDHRIKAAAVLSGDPEEFAGGHYDYTRAPPMLLLHGTDDVLLPYSQAVDVFNDAQGPKGLLTLDGADHSTWLQPSSKYFASAFKATSDFFAAYLRGNQAARRRIAHDGQQGVTTMHFVPKRGSTTTIPTVPKPTTNRKASVTPTTNLTDGQMVTVTWSGYIPGKVVNIVQCSRARRRAVTRATSSTARSSRPTPTARER